MRPITRRALRALAALAVPLFAECALARPAAAQDADPPAVERDTVLEVRLSDGSVLYGRVAARSADGVTLVTDGGATVRLRRDQIASMEPLRGRIVNGQVWPEDPHPARLFLAPTARAVPRGAGYLAVYELVFPFVTYGVTDRLTISAGMPAIPEAIGRVVYLGPKYEVLRTPSVRAAVGMLALFATEDALGDWTPFGVLNGVATFGGPDGAVTVGATVPFLTADGSTDLPTRPVLMLGAEARLSRRTKFLTENYVVPYGSLVAGGFRFFGERLSADFGIGAAFGEDEISCCLPLVNFVYAF